MARIALGLATSHSPMLSMPPEYWREYAQVDRTMPDLIYPPGQAVPYETAVATLVAPELAARLGDDATFAEQGARIAAALDTLRDTLSAAAPDVTVIVSDDQDEWFYDGNMPALSVFWGESIPVVPWTVPDDARPPARYRALGYGDVPVTVPVDAKFGRHVVESLMDHGFDVGSMQYVQPRYGGSVRRLYPTPDGELDHVERFPEREVGLPHGYAFIVKRLFENQPGPILPILQNTCYPPNNVRPERAWQLGRALAEAITAWDGVDTVAVIGSGGLSHMVVDEEQDRAVLAALVADDDDVLRHLPQQRIYAPTSETLNWVTTGAALRGSGLAPEIVDYVPVYRTEAGTGGGWAFMRWT